MEHDRFHVPYLSDKTLEAVFHSQTVKTVAYLRVSTALQDVRNQRLAILEYARKHDFRIDDFIEATASVRYATDGKSTSASCGRCHSPVPEPGIKANGEQKPSHGER